MRQRSSESPAPSPASPQGEPAPAAAAPTPSLDAAITAFKVVGIGASAGGLEALEAFFRAAPRASEAAYVVVQHLDPTHTGMLAELLQRVTAIPVGQIADGVRLEPDHVYVIPPGKSLTLEHGALRLHEPVAARGARLPIDEFFRSLADAAGAQAVGVVLSGMGSDGTLGLRAIKAKGGRTCVQDPKQAKFDGMPRSAIDAGVADCVAAAEALPGAVLTPRAAHVPVDPASPARTEPPTVDEAALAEILAILKQDTGQDFRQYKSSTMLRRIERRMGLHQMDAADRYIALLRSHPPEAQLLFKDLLIGVTHFFRDPDVWAQLKEQLVQLLGTRSTGTPLRAWVAGCATGEEAYTLAIIFREALARLEPAREHRLQIFATDLDRESIDIARAGVYGLGIAEHVSPERLKRHFVLTDHGYQIGTSIRESVIFAPHNLCTDPPFTRLDLISCRNLLIYLTPELQQRIMPLFHYSLRPGGLLLLGTAETTGSASDLFKEVPGTPRLYVRRDTGDRATPVQFQANVASAGRVPAAPRELAVPPNLQQETERYLLQRCTPAALLVNEQGDILCVSGKTGAYLEPATGRANFNVFAMAREGLRTPLSAAFRMAMQSDEPVHRADIRIESPGITARLDLTVQKLQEPASLRGLLMVLLRDVPEPKAAAPSAAAGTPVLASALKLEQELAQATLELQSMREAMQSSQEELGATNEELQSANEELQSTNEELMTSKEEMQSMNEELQTLNHELQARVDNLSQLANDVKNLLDSTDIATIFIDAKLQVRLFSAGSRRIFRLLAVDVGRPLGDFASELDYPKLTDDAREVLRTLAVHETTVRSHDGHWFVVRMLPYLTLDNRVDGVAITFSDVTKSKQIEAELRTTQTGLEQHIVAQDKQLERGAPPAAAPPAVSPTDDAPAETP